jgi:hypothetical protein
MVDPLAAIFPQLAKSAYQVTSPATDVYNCIAWAAQDTARWWWPEAGQDVYWPASAARDETLTAFQDAFGSLGYAVCADAAREEGFHKIAIFALARVPTHAARQLTSGRWTSRLGIREDIEHDLHDLEGVVYGQVTVIMKRGTVP